MRAGRSGGDRLGEGTGPIEPRTVYVGASDNCDPPARVRDLKSRVSEGTAQHLVLHAPTVTVHDLSVPAPPQDVIPAKAHRRQLKK